MTFNEYIERSAFDLSEYQVGYFDGSMFWSGKAPTDELKDSLEILEQLRKEAPHRDWRIILRKRTVKYMEVPTSKSQVDPV